MLPWSAKPPAPPTLFAGNEVAADAVRLTILFVGVTLALLLFRVAITTARNRNFETAAGMTATAFFALSTPATGLFRFGEGVLLYPTVIYGLGLAFGIFAMSRRFTLHRRRVRDERDRKSR